MIRFVDLRRADIEGVRFAYWNTVINRFVEANKEQGWYWWTDALDDLRHDGFGAADLTRFYHQTPDWVHGTARQLTDVAVPPWVCR